MDNNKVDISVIMPAYNAESYIAQALDSILSQKFSGTFDIWVADDISSDSTGAIIQEYKNRFPELVNIVPRPENLGCSSNSLDLVKHSDGKYVAFCDNDDYWVDTLKLQKQFDYLEVHEDCGMVCCAAQIVNEQGTVTHFYGTPFVESFLEMIQRPQDVLNSSVMLRKELYIKMVEDSKWFIDNKCFFDTVWAYWFAFHSKIHYMPEYMIAYRELTESESHTENKDRLYFYDKRYWTLKARFLLSHDMDIEDKMTVLSNEYDYLYKNAYQQGVDYVRSTQPYKVGRLLKKLQFWKK